MSQARKAVEQIVCVCVCVCVCVFVCVFRVWDFCTLALNRCCSSMRPSTFGHVEALCFHGKHGVWGGLRSHVGRAA